MSARRHRFHWATGVLSLFALAGPVFLTGTLLLFTLPLRALVVIQAGEENKTLRNDRFSGPVRLAMGDFNGDGMEDTVAGLIDVSHNRLDISLFFGGYANGSSFSAEERMRVVANSVTGGVYSLVLADLDNDGKKDLVIGAPSQGSGGQVYVVFGSSAPPSGIILDTTPGIFTIYGKASSQFGFSAAVGDFNGDGRDDLVIGAPTANECYLLLGGQVSLSGTIDLAVGTPLKTIQGTAGSNFGSFVAAGNFNGDSSDDLVLSAPRASLSGHTWNGEINILFGRAIFPSVWTLGSPAADVQIIGASDNRLIVGSAAGDMTGDHKDELLVQGGFGATLAFLLAGADIGGGGILDLSAGAVTSYPVVSPAVTYSGVSGFGDFDGDGFKDLFVTESNRIGAILSTDFGTSGVDLNDLTGYSLLWEGIFETLVLADVNEDGLQDVAAYRNLGAPTLPPYGFVSTLYGFEPLRNPSIQINSPSPPSPRVRLALNADGNPIQMKLSGDLTDSFKDQWIPYSAEASAILTSSSGTKTVSVVFRNSVNRESALVSDTLALAPGAAGVVTGTNRLRRGASAAFDCHVTESTRLRARVFNAQAEEVRNLADMTVEPGIVPVVWDGQDGSGKRASPGVYFLVMELYGERIKKKILVE